MKTNGFDQAAADVATRQEENLAHLRETISTGKDTAHVNAAIDAVEATRQEVVALRDADSA